MKRTSARADQRMVARPNRIFERSRDVVVFFEIRAIAQDIRTAGAARQHVENVADADA